MDKNTTSTSKAKLTLGIMGFIAGIFLMFSDKYIIGIFGGIASAGLALKAFQDLKKK